MPVYAPLTTKYNRRTSWVVTGLESAVMLFLAGLVLLHLNPFWHFDESGFLDWRVHWWNIAAQVLMAAGLFGGALASTALAAGIVSQMANRRRWPYVVAALMVGCAAVWISLGGFTRTVDAHFEWNIADGFEVFHLQTWDNAAGAWREAEAPLWKLAVKSEIQPLLLAYFKLNDWQRYYAFEEMADVYLASKIVVNVLRDDYPEDANMRAFEAMAAGCLLISRMPTELTAAGFQEGVHFVPYRDESEIPDLVAKYLTDDGARQRIADAGREKVFGEHTYDCRAEQLLQIIERSNGKFFAPARQWPQDRVRLLHLDYYTANGNLGYAGNELMHISSRNLWATARGGAIMARGIASRARYRLASLAGNK